MRFRGLSVVILMTSLPAFAGSIPTDWTRAIVSIEVQDQGAFRQVGTGFFASPDHSKPFRPILVTARHVLEAVCPSLTAYLRFENSPNDPNGAPHRYPVQICEQTVVNGQISRISKFVVHPRVDLAGIIPVTQDAPSVTVFGPDDLAGPAEIRKWNVAESDEIFTISFSPNLVPDRPSSGTIRGGVIANFSEQADSFIVDSLVFPGNSGCPVVLKPVAVHSADGHNFTIGQVNPALLVGVVVEYVPYAEIAVSTQTQRPRVSFEENSGLTRVIRSDRVKELVELMTSLLPPNP